MALDPVPWFIGGGAQHSAEAARNLAWTATNGRTGIATPDDLEVSETSVPSGAVYVSTGGGAVSSSYAGASQQSYMIRNPVRETVTVPPNTSSSPVTRYVIAEVSDPQYAGSPPSNVAEGPYTFFRVVSSLSRTHPFIPLARLRIPGNTSTITNSMITDIRELLSPRRQEFVFARPRVASDDSSQNLLKARISSGGEFFPGGGGSPNEFQVPVPEWAELMIVEADWISVRYQGGKSSWGNYWMEYGTEYRSNSWPGFANNKHQYEFATQDFSWDQAENSATYRTNWRLMDTRTVPNKIKGKNTTFVFKAAVSDSSNAQTGVASMDRVSGLGCRLTFIESPRSNWQGAN